MPHNGYGVMGFLAIYQYIYSLIQRKVPIMGEKMQIIDYIDVESISSLLAQNPLLPRLFFTITDLEGNIRASSQWKGICQNYYRCNPDTLQRCVESDTILASKIKEGERYALYACYNSLTDAAMPIIVEGEMIGNLIIGQVFTQPPDMDFFAEQADRFGFERKAFLEAVKEVPVIEESKLREIMQFYAGLASMIGSIAYQAYQYKELADMLIAKTEQLEYVNSELEAFTYSTSHDLRAPLRHITGYIDLFNRRSTGQLDEQGRHYFDAIYDSAKQMGMLIDDLLQFSRNGRTEMMQSETDMKNVVDECM